MPRLSATLAVLVLLVPAGAAAETFTAGPSDDVEAMIGALEAGDELVLDDGMYTITERFSFDIAGTEAMPIVVRAAAGARPHFHRPNASQNIWDLRASYVVFRGLAFSGGSAGLRFEQGSYVTLEDCEISETADVAIRMNDSGQTYEGMRILRNHIHDTGGTGEGMYLGCNNDGCRLANALIEGNYIHHTDASDVSQGDGIEIKEGSYGNIVRDNVIHDTNYPCILTYSAAGNGPPNIIERNVMWACGDHAIQSAADATIRNNIILGAAANGIAMQPHQSGTPSNLIVVHNTILAPGNDAISVRNATGSVLIANNALYAQSGSALRVIGDASGLTLAGNVGVGSWGGSGGFAMGDLSADFTAASFSGGLPNNVFPTSSGGLYRSGSSEHAADDDFDGRLRGGLADVGAYSVHGDGPGWTLAEAFKNVSDPTPVVDGGMPTADGGPGSDASVAADGGSARADGGPGMGEDGGCSCRAGPGTPGSSNSVFGLLAVAAFLGLRRPRRSAR